MSVGIVRVQKMTSGSVKGIEIHDLREKDGISHSNPDIDWDFSNLNYDAHPENNKNFYKAVKERINQLNLPKAVRKDAIVMAQVLVTSDHEFFKNLPQDKMKQFFEDSYKFLSNRYGKDNVISAVVHLDERTPHMHFNFVPVTTDGRLSAKSILTRQSLIEQQTAFYEQVGKYHGLNRGMTKDERIEKGNYRKNMTVPEYKAYTAELERVKQEVSKLSETKQNALESVSKAQEEVKGIETSLIPLKAEYEARKAYIDECDKASSVSMYIPDFAEVKQKGIFKKKEFVTVPKEKWIEKHVSANEKSYLKKAREEFEAKVCDFQRTSTGQYIRQLEQKNQDYKNEISKLKLENNTLKGKVTVAEKEVSNVLDKINKVLSKLPQQIAQPFIEKWNAKEKSRSHEMEL